MNPREIYNSKIAEFFGYNITLMPFIFYIGVPSVSTRVHEFVHVWQVKRDGWFKFYFRYLKQWVCGLISGMSSYDSYMAIDYEVQAYAMQSLFDEWFKNNYPVNDQMAFEYFLKRHGFKA